MICAVSMVKDEIDVIGGMLAHLRAEVDHIIISDNGSTDGTRDVLSESDVTVIDDPDPAYYQSDKMTRLAAMAGEMGATWIVPVDADEIWIAPDRISGVLGAMRDSVNIVTADLYNHFPSAIDPEGDDPFATIVWRQREPGALPKVAFRWEPGAVIMQGNHDVRLREPRRFKGALEVRHFPYRSADQFVRKARNGAAAYAASDLPESWGAHWRSYGAILERHGEEALREVFAEHFYFTSPIDNGLVYDPAPYRRWESLNGQRDVVT